MTRQEIGQRIYRLRMAKKWTQQVLADRAGISCRTLQAMEAHRISPTIETVRKLALALGCDWADLLGSVK